jgi:hypothetical protein
VAVQRPQAGVNGAVVPGRDRLGRPGFRFQAPDGTNGTVYVPRDLPSFLKAVNDWRAWLARKP